jgi:hypothetical protein
MEKLFAGRSVYRHMDEQHLKMRTAVNSVTREELERGGVAGVVDALMARCALTVPKLGEDRMLPPSLEERGSYGAEVTISLPFTGDRTLFFVQPSDHAIRLNADLDIPRSVLVFSYSSPTRDAAVIRAEVDRLISGIRAALAQLERDLHAGSGPLRAEVQEAVERHQALLAAHPAAAGLAGPKTPT